MNTIRQEQAPKPALKWQRIIGAVGIFRSDRSCEKS